MHMHDGLSKKVIGDFLLSKILDICLEALVIWKSHDGLAEYTA